jgi:hypothetical protein
MNAGKEKGPDAIWLVDMPAAITVYSWAVSMMYKLSQAFKDAPP